MAGTTEFDPGLNVHIRRVSLDCTVNLLVPPVKSLGHLRNDVDIFVEVANRLGFKDRDGASLIVVAERNQVFAHAEVWEEFAIWSLGGRPICWLITGT